MQRIINDEFIDLVNELYDLDGEDVHDILSKAEPKRPIKDGEYYMCPTCGMGTTKLRRPNTQAKTLNPRTKLKLYGSWQHREYCEWCGQKFFWD